MNATGEPVVRPDGFDLAETWQSVVDTIEERRRTVRVTVLMPGYAVPWVQQAFGTDLDVVGARPDGRTEVTLGVSSARQAAERLAAWGRLLEVVEPSEVRDELARIGSELVAAYGSRRAPPMLSSEHANSAC